MFWAHRRRLRWFWWLLLISFPGFDTQTVIFEILSLLPHNRSDPVCVGLLVAGAPPPPSDLSKVQERTVSSAEFIRLQASL